MTELTGRHVAMIFGGAFAVIVTVNLTLAYQAVRTFPGLVTENSYVASQRFEAERDAQDALGWDVALTHRAGVLRLAVADAAGPVRPALGELRLGRATHRADDLAPAFAWTGSAWEAPVDLAPGRWVLELAAEAPDGTPFRQRLSLWVPS